MKVIGLLFLLCGLSDFVYAKGVSQAVMRKRTERLLASVNKIDDAIQELRKRYKNNNPTLTCAVCNQSNECGWFMCALSFKVLGAAERSRKQFELWIERFEAFEEVASSSTAEYINDFMVSTACHAGFTCRRCKNSAWIATVCPNFYLSQQVPLMITTE